jgi:DNA-binding NtrC family response regulator
MEILDDRTTTDAPSRAAQVLFVDDSLVERVLTEAMLKTTAVEFVIATGVADALSKISLHKNNLKLVTSDLMMDDGFGDSLYEAVRSNCPKSAFYLLTSEFGYRPIDAECAVIQKPMGLEALRALVEKFTSSRT